MVSRLAAGLPCYPDCAGSVRLLDGAGVSVEDDDEPLPWWLLAVVAIVLIFVLGMMVEFVLILHRLR